MISLKNLKMKNEKKVLNTKKEVQEVQKRLENFTEYDLKSFQKAKLRTHAKSRFIFLD